MINKLNDMSGCLKDINESIDSLFIAAAAMVQDADELEAKGINLSSERLSAHNISCIATAFDSKVRDAMEALGELADALGHEINIDLNSL